VQARLPVKCRIELRYCEQIARSAGGKFEDFMSEISAGARG
jgi:hypothetical protein